MATTTKSKKTPPKTVKKSPVKTTLKKEKKATPKNSYNKKLKKEINHVVIIYPFTYINPYMALPPIAAEYMQAGIAHAGKSVTLLDMRYEGDVQEELNQADLVCIQGYFEDCSIFGKWNIHVIDEILEQVPENTPIVAGGTGFSDHEEAMLRYPKVDIVIRGNPEIPMIELLKKGSPEKIDNLVYRTGKKVHLNRRIIHALDEEIYPKRSLRNPRYEYHIAGIKVDLLRAAVGCNYRCKFCFEYGKDFDGTYLKWQGRSAQSIHNELQEIDAPLVGWVDDDMTTDMQMLSDLSDLLLASKTKKLFMGTGRIDHVVKSNVEALKKMERAGFLALSFGVESLKNETLKFYGKGQTIDSIEESMKMMQKTNILLICNFILGSPGETEEDMMEMLFFGRKWNVDTLVTNRFRMKKDALMYDMVVDPKTGEDRPNMKRVRGEELARIKYKIKFGQRSPLRVWLLLLKLYRHRGMFLDPFYFFFSILDTAIKHTWLEKTLILPGFFKFMKFIFWLPPVRWISWAIAWILTPPVKLLNYLFELIDNKLGISTSILPKFFLFLKGRLYDKQRENINKPKASQAK